MPMRVSWHGSTPKFLNDPERIVEETLDLAMMSAEETLARLRAGRTA